MKISEIHIGVAILLPILIYWIYWRWTHRRMLKLASSVPGPPTIPIFGNALLFMAKPEEQLKKIGDLLDIYGHYVKFWLGPDLNICVKDPKDIRFLLTSNKVSQKGPSFEFMTKFIGRGLLTGGPTWRIYRKIVTPSYNKKSVEVFSAIFNKEADDLTEVLKNKDSNKTFNVYYDVVYSTTQSVCQTLLGLSKHDSLNVKFLEELVLKTQSIYTLIFTKMTCWWLQIPFIYWITGYKRQEEIYSNLINETASDVIFKRRKALQKEPVDEDTMGVVDRLLLEGISEQEIKYQMAAVFTTSQEASAKIASGVLLVLAHLPEWQDKVYNEIIENLGPDENVTNDMLKNFHYLDMVYKEVLRYLPIAAMVQRTVEEEITINNGKITVPARTSLMIPIHEVHRGPLFWDEPMKVKPERFLPENVNKTDPNAFIPFSLGSMDCLGRVYAPCLIKTLVVKVLREVQFEADGRLEDLDLHVAISVRFAKGYNLRARKRCRK